MTETAQQNAPEIESSWLKMLKEEFEKPYFSELKSFLKEEKNAGKTIYPPGNQIFAAYNNCPFDRVKIVIIGQDPYHGPNQANGLSFSVNRNIRKPPSLENIFKELKHDLKVPIPDHGDLTAWADQGVLLLNAILTVRANEAGSHRDKGWEHFTNATIRRISTNKTGVIFLLWGNFAQEKADLIDQEKHFVLTAAHPSPFSANNGFLGCRHFSKANELLKSMGKEAIDWNPG